MEDEESASSYDEVLNKYHQKINFKNNKKR
jgi:hypothetical protein